MNALVFEDDALTNESSRAGRSTAVQSSADVSSLLKMSLYGLPFQQTAVARAFQALNTRADSPPSVQAGDISKNICLSTP